jgi:hypothetical protein
VKNSVSVPLGIPAITMEVAVTNSLARWISSAPGQEMINGLANAQRPQSLFGAICGSDEACIAASIENYVVSHLFG